MRKSRHVLRKVHRLNQAIHGQARDNEDVSRLYKEIDTLYGLQEASQQAAHRLGTLRAVLDTQLKLHEDKSTSICINQIINDAVLIAASHTQNVSLTTTLDQNLPIITGYQSHLTHIVIYLLKDAANRIDCTLATTAGDPSEHFIRIKTAGRPTREREASSSISMIQATKRPDLHMSKHPRRRTNGPTMLFF